MSTSKSFHFSEYFKQERGIKTIKIHTHGPRENRRVTCRGAQGTQASAQVEQLQNSQLPRSFSQAVS